ncbi:MAG: flap endonuclease Xni [Thermoanaerobaculia bacterium]
MGQQRNTLLLVDALNLIRRIYAAQPGEDGHERVERATVSSVRSLQRALRECQPSHAVCVFDGEGRSWRHELHPGYKAGHTAMPEALADGLEGYREAFAECGVASLSIPGIEADDVIATAAQKAAAAGALAVILSNDKSFLQLLPEGVRVHDHFRRTDLDAAYVTDRFGVRPDQLADLLALAGDRGNGIPGVDRVGAKSASKLLDQFGTLEVILESADVIEGRLGEYIRSAVETARLCRKLVGLRTDLELGTNLNELRYRPPVAGS